MLLPFIQQSQTFMTLTVNIKVVHNPTCLIISKYQILTTPIRLIVYNLIIQLPPKAINFIYLEHLDFNDYKNEINNKK